MTRIIATIALITLVVTGLTTSCSEDAKNPVDPGRFPFPEYENLTQKDHVLLNLSRAYNKMNFDEYARLLDEDLTFFFSTVDVESCLVDSTSWGMSSEETATSNMFNGVPSPGEGFVIDRIDLRLDYVPGDDVWVLDVGAPGNHDGEDWHERTVTYNLSINAGNESFISTDIVASFVIKPVDVDGTLRWKIIAWRDDIDVTSFRRPSIHRHTWGQVKSMFR